MKRFAPFVWLGYLLVPVEGWGLFPGRPLGAFEALALAAFLWLWWVRRPPAFALLAVAALVAKIALGTTLLAPRGFDARYYANAEFAGPVEGGTEPADPSFTRTDRRLSFLGGEAGDLPLYFLNDIRRFNFYLPKEPQRETLPVSVTWEGWLRVTKSRLTRVYVRTPGGHVVMSVGEDVSALIRPSTSEWVGYVTPKAGFERLRITLSIPQGAPRAFEAGWTVEGREEPFDSAIVFRKPMTRAGLAADSFVRAISTTLDLVLCGLLFGSVLYALGGAWRRLTISPAVGDALAVLWVAVIVDALLFAGHFRHQMVTLSGGNDWLNYESRARDIGLNSIWMLGGLPLGQGNPFYQMPFYPYFVAAAHWLFGDDLFGVYLAQRLLVGATAIALWRVTAALFGERVGCAGLLAAIVIAYEKITPWSGILLTELLFVPLVCIWALLLVKIGKSATPSLLTAAGAGVIGGLATITRSSLLLAWPFALALVALSLGRRNLKQTAKIVVVIALALMAATSLATIRNWVVSRQFVLISTYGPINLFLNNQPPRPLIVPAGHKATYDRLGLDPYTQTVIEFGRQMPRQFFGLWTRRGTYALGWFKWFIPAQGISIFYMAAASIGLAGVLLLAARPPWLPPAGPASLIALAIAMTHFAVLVIVDSSTYGDRLLLAFYALLAPYIGIVAFGLHRGLWSVAGRGTGLAIWLAVFGACAWRLSGGLPELNLPLLTVAALVWGLCAFGVPRLPGSAAAAYGALAIGLCLWAAVRGTASAEHAGRMDLLVVVTAFGSSTMIAGVSKLRLPEVPLLAWLGAGTTALTLVALHGLTAGVPVMIMAGLILGAAQSLLLPSELRRNLYA